MEYNEIIKKLKNCNYKTSIDEMNNLFNSIKEIASNHNMSVMDLFREKRDLLYNYLYAIIISDNYCFMEDDYLSLIDYDTLNTYFADEEEYDILNELGFDNYYLDYINKENGADDYDNNVRYAVYTTSQGYHFGDECINVEIINFSPEFRMQLLEFYLSKMNVSKEILIKTAKLFSKRKEEFNFYDDSLDDMLNNEIITKEEYDFLEKNYKKYDDLIYSDYFYGEIDLEKIINLLDIRFDFDKNNIYANEDIDFDMINDNYDDVNELVEKYCDENDITMKHQIGDLNDDDLGIDYLK